MLKKMVPVIMSVVGSAILLTVVFLLLGNGHAEAGPTGNDTNSGQDDGVQLSPGYSQYADPGVIVTYTHVLTNTDLTAKILYLEALNSHGWTVTLSGEAWSYSTATLIITVTGNATATFAVGVTAPPTVATDITATTLITATSAIIPNGYHTATDITIVRKGMYYVYLPTVKCNYIPDWSRGGLAGHMVYQIAVCAADPQRLYAGTEAGVFRSTDGGASWQPTGLQGVLVRGLDVAANDCNHVYAATWGQHMQYSPDGGGSWNKLGTNLPEAYLYTTVVDPASNRLYAGTANNGVYQFRDGGTGWESIFYQAGAGTVARLTVAAPNILLVATWGGNAYRLVLTGTTWNASALGVPENNVFEVVQGSGDVLFAAAENRLYRKVKTNPWSPVWEQGRRAYGVAMDPDQPQVVYAAAADGAWRSTDGGGTFSRFGLEGLAAVRHIAPGPPNSTLLHAGTADGAWRRTRPVSIGQRR